jgi:hypothetical protein
MKKTTQRSFSIGQKLWKYSLNDILEYEIIAELELGKKLYLKCLSCRHGYNCIVLVEVLPDGNISYVQTENDNEYNDEAYYHTTSFKDNCFYRESINLAKIDYLNYIKSTLKNEIQRHKSLIQEAEKSLEQKDALIKELTTNNEAL